MWRLRIVMRRLRLVGRRGARSVTRNAAPPSSPSTERDVAVREDGVLLRDGQPQTHALLLERDGRLEQGRGRVCAESRARNRALRWRPPHRSVAVSDEHRAVRRRRLRRHSAAGWSGCPSRDRPPRARADARSSSRRSKRRLRMRAALQRHALGDERVDVQRLERHRSARWQNSENARTRRSSDSISLTTICAA